jgi:hypothetical protein
MAEPVVDQIAPWTIKACPVRTREIVVRAAQRENLTVGQWLERRVDEWEGAGSPVPVAENRVGNLVSVMTAAGTLPADGGLPREVRALINEMARRVRAGLAPGLPGQKPGLLLTSPATQG